MILNALYVSALLVLHAAVTATDGTIEETTVTGEMTAEMIVTDGTATIGGVINIVYGAALAAPILNSLMVQIQSISLLSVFQTNIFIQSRCWPSETTSNTYKKPQ